VTAHPRPDADRDEGAILLLVLAVSIVLSLVVLALANFVAADLRYAQVVDAQAKRLASAESGIDFAVDRLRLNQTLCATEAAAGGAVNLDGSVSNPPGTQLLQPVIAAVPQPVNGTDTRVTCERLDDPADGPIADVAGWAVIIANYGETPPNDQIRVDDESTEITNTAFINGPVFLPGATKTNTAGNARIEVVDGDLWYNRAPSCTPLYSNTTLAAAPGHITITPADSRGGICTPRLSGTTFLEPPVPMLLATPADADGDDLAFPGCRVFSPGTFASMPVLTGATDSYFRSGDYLFDFDNEWLVSNAVTSAKVWAGYPESPADLARLGPCASAAADDAANAFPVGGGQPGATFYLSRHSVISLDAGGVLEIFPRRQGNHIVSIQALSTSNDDQTLLEVNPLSRADLVVHGLVWAPRSQITIADALVADQQLLGGVVVRRLHLLHIAPDFEIRPASSAVDTQVLLTSTSTLNGAKTTVEAVVSYRPHAPDLEDRVAVTSFRVVD
jgi:hypothetical protein